MTYELKYFTPAEAAKVSGVSVTTQRDWRRRGFLPKNDGHARFSVFEVAEMLVLNSLGAQGIGPSQVKAVLPSLGAGVVGAAFDNPQSVTGDLDSIYLQPERVGRLLEYLASSKEDPADEYHPLWRERSYRLRESMMKQGGHEPLQIGYCALMWADGSIAFYGSPIQAYETVEDRDRRRAGAVVIIDFSGIARSLIARSGPILTLKHNENGPAAGHQRQIEMIAAALAEAKGRDHGT